jgi:uncharacterized membrane protein
LLTDDEINHKYDITCTDLRGYMNFLLKLLSGPDNNSPDVARVLLILTWIIWAIACVMFLYRAQTPDSLLSGFPTLFGIGSGLLLSGASSILIKHMTEPKP